MNNIQRIYPDLIFTHLKKHNCPNCDNKMSLIKVCKIVNSKSLEAKNYDFSHGDSYLHGDVKFIWDDFKCDNCGLQISIKDLRKIEKANRAKEKERKRK